MSTAVLPSLLPCSPELLSSAQLSVPGVPRELVAELLFGGERLRILQQQKRPIPEHLSEYRQHLSAKGNGPKHVRDTFRRARLLLRLCRASFWPDLQPQSIRLAIPKLLAARPRRKTIGLATANHYLASLRGFCAWMVANDRAERSPCRSVRPLNAALDVRRRRRALSHEEALRLIDAANRGRSIAKVPGSERALGYVLALTTGLRASELTTLTSAVFRLSGPDRHVVVEAAYAKGKRRQIVPLRADVAELVKAHLRECGRHSQIFRRPKNGVRALREDLTLAGIPYKNAAGEYVDFHALRHTFVTNLFETGATPKEAQVLARHQDARLTLGRYAHASDRAQRAAVERLPQLAGV